jgi:hypothetical protein
MAPSFGFISCHYNAPIPIHITFSIKTKEYKQKNQKHDMNNFFNYFLDTIGVQQMRSQIYSP